VAVELAVQRPPERKKRKKGGKKRRREKKNKKFHVTVHVACHVDKTTIKRDFGPG
jgi:HSP20 family molecular chaperone IbpA